MNNQLLHRASSILSFMLHPFMIPTYATLLLMFGSDSFTFLPFALRQKIAMNIVVNTLLIPALLIFLSYRLGLIKDLAIDERKSRIIPILLTGVCYALSMYLLSDIMLIYVVRKFMLVALLCILAVLIVTFKWKISLHLTAMGGFVAMIYILNLSRMFYSPVLLGAVILLSGLLGSARLILNKHTPAQIAAGFGCGLIICVVTMLFL